MPSLGSRPLFPGPSKVGNDPKPLLLFSEPLEDPLLPTLGGDSLLPKSVQEPREGHRSRGGEREEPAYAFRPGVHGLLRLGCAGIEPNLGGRGGQTHGRRGRFAP